MELWEIAAREEIRDLVARYNANGDSGRFAEVLELFAPDASMVVENEEHRGHDQIRAVFSGAADGIVLPEGERLYLRHHTSTLQIDVIDRRRATARCYFQVITAAGLDHWGRYLDAYCVVEDRWRFARRQVTVDGYSPVTIFRRGGAGSGGAAGPQEK